MVISIEIMVVHAQTVCVVEIGTSFRNTEQDKLWNDCQKNQVDS